MKKLLTVLLSALLLTASVLGVSCAKTEEKTLSFFAPDGAPALAISKYIKDGENFGTDAVIKYGVVNAENIGAKVLKGEGDLVIIPVNAASKLYKANQSDPYRMAGVITHGNLYIVSREEISLTDLKGAKVGVIGEGLVPDVTLKAVLNKNSLSYVGADLSAGTDKVGLKYYAGNDAPAQIMPALENGELKAGLLPEPAVTNLTKNETFYRLNLGELYDAETKAYPQAVLLVKESVIQNYPTLVTKISESLDGGVEWLKNNTADGVGAIKANFDGTTLKAPAITPDVVDNCSIYFESAQDAKTSVKDYLNAIIDVEASSAKSVADDFFYGE